MAFLCSTILCWTTSGMFADIIGTTRLKLLAFRDRCQGIIQITITKFGKHCGNIQLVSHPNIQVDQTLNIEYWLSRSHNRGCWKQDRHSEDYHWAVSRASDARKPLYPYLGSRRLPRFCEGRRQKSLKRYARLVIQRMLWRSMDSSKDREWIWNPCIGEF